jgi:Leucine-rich repeat (LRR) protein
MPNVDITLALFFKHITTLDVSHNCIESLEAQHLSKACPVLEVFIFNNNQVSNIREILPLGRLKHLKTLEFRNNPVVATPKLLRDMKEKVIYEQKQLSASEKMKFPSLSLINGEHIEIPLNDD